MGNTPSTSPNPRTTCSQYYNQLKDCKSHLTPPLQLTDRYPLNATDVCEESGEKGRQIKWDTSHRCGKSSLWWVSRSRNYRPIHPYVRLLCFFLFVPRSIYNLITSHLRTTLTSHVPLPEYALKKCLAFALSPKSAKVLYDKNAARKDRVSANDKVVPLLKPYLWNDGWKFLGSYERFVFVERLYGIYIFINYETWECDWYYGRLTSTFSLLLT